MVSFLSMYSPFAYVSIFPKLLFQKHVLINTNTEVLCEKNVAKNRSLIKSSRYIQKLGKKTQNIQKGLEF